MDDILLESLITNDSLEMEWDEMVEATNEMADESSDFEVGDYRFIRNEDIDEIMQDELSNDEYILGCFKDYFLCSVLSIDVDVIQAMQKAEAFEAIGKLVLSLDKIEELQEEYVSTDGYGHHFSHYDGHDIELGQYHAFRIN